MIRVSRLSAGQADPVPDKRRDTSGSGWMVVTDVSCDAGVLIAGAFSHSYG